MAAATPSSRAPPEFANGGGVQSFHPATFAERGVAVPFTTPALAGVRMRARPKLGLDLVVPNPSGGRGVYLIGWASVGEFCRPTVHDRCLAGHLARDFRRHGVLGPAEMRDAARAVAIEGFAGQEAAAAAAAAIQADAAAATSIGADLLQRLLQQLAPQSPSAGPQHGPNAAGPNAHGPGGAGPGGAGPGALGPGALATPALRSLAQAVAPLIAPLLTAPTSGTASDGHAAIATMATEIGTLLVRCGLGCGPCPGRLTLLLAQLSEIAEQWRTWTADPTDPAARIAALTGSSLAVTKLALFSVLTRAQALTEAPLTLLQNWVADRDKIAVTAARPAWLLDGWDRIAARWALAEDAAGQRAALTDFAMMVPPLPQEAASWAELKLDVESPQGLRRSIRLQSTWRSAIATMDATQLHERLLAQS